MKHFLFLIGLFLTNSVCAQYLFQSDDWPDQWMIVTIDGKTKVNVTARDPRQQKNNIVDQAMEFYYYQGRIVSDYIDDEGNSFSGKNYPMNCFPNYVKIKNNNFQLGSELNDSIIIDRKGRVSKVYSATIDKNGYINPNSQNETNIRYLSDTSVLIFSRSNYIANNSFIMGLVLDTTSNIKLVIWPDDKIDSSLRDSIISRKKELLELNNYGVSRFNYNTSNAQILNIQSYTSHHGKKALQFTQYFVYKNGRLVSSYIINETTKERIRIYSYTYKPIKN